MPISAGMFSEPSIGSVNPIMILYNKTKYASPQETCRKLDVSEPSKDSQGKRGQSEAHSTSRLK